MKFAREAWPFVVPFFVLALGLGLFGLLWWALVAALLGFAVLLFFRDPTRAASGDERTVLAPADGLVTQVDTVEDPAVGPGSFQRIVTFLSVFDVHVQKAPVAGEVVASLYTPGAKKAAFVADVDKVNENHLTVIRRGGGDRVGIRQIAGLLARRVVCYLEEGQTVNRAQPMGLIKFSSRVDLYVPASYEVLVAKGDRLRNGATAVARTSDAASGSDSSQGSGPSDGPTLGREVLT
jgi:phosphatidylserine decarboxylase